MKSYNINLDGMTESEKSNIIINNYKEKTSDNLEGAQGVAIGSSLYVIGSLCLSGVGCIPTIIAFITIFTVLSLSSSYYSQEEKSLLYLFDEDDCQLLGFASNNEMVNNMQEKGFIKFIRKNNWNTSKKIRLLQRILYFIKSIYIQYKKYNNKYNIIAKRINTMKDDDPTFYSKSELFDLVNENAIVTTLKSDNYKLIRTGIFSSLFKIEDNIKENIKDIDNKEVFASDIRKILLKINNLPFYYGGKRKHTCVLLVKFGLFKDILLSSIITFNDIHKNDCNKFIKECSNIPQDQIDDCYEKDKNKQLQMINENLKKLELIKKKIDSISLQDEQIKHLINKSRKLSYGKKILWDKQSNISDKDLEFVNIENIQRKINEIEKYKKYADEYNKELTDYLEFQTKILKYKKKKVKSSTKQKYVNKIKEYEKKLKKLNLNFTGGIYETLTDLIKEDVIITREHISIFDKIKEIGLTYSELTLYYKSKYDEIEKQKVEKRQKELLEKYKLTKSEIDELAFIKNNCKESLIMKNCIIAEEDKNQCIKDTNNRFEKLVYTYPKSYTTQV